jgi:extradiol dioxygenase
MQRRGTASARRFSGWGSPSPAPTEPFTYAWAIDRHHDLAQERSLPITLSLGRHAMGTLVSFYMRSPSGFGIEFGAGGALLGDNFVQVNPSHSEVWGHKPLVKGWAPTVKPVPA